MKKYIEQFFFMIAVLFIGNRVFNHVDAWLGIAICFGVCYPFINIIKLIIKNMKTKIKFMLVALMATVIFSSCERVAPNYAGVLMENYGKKGKMI